MKNELQTKQDELLEFSKLAYDRGYLSATEGNLSIRLPENLILSTASNTCKSRLNKSDLLISDLDGKLIDSPDLISRDLVSKDFIFNTNKLSTELNMHILIYKLRPDIKAIIHAHPTTAVGFTLANKTLENPILPEIVCTLGSIPTAPYATPGTEEVQESIRDLIPDYEAIMLSQHGAVCYANTLAEAFYKLESLEHFAKTLLVAELLGGAKKLDEKQIEKLLKNRSIYGLTKPVRIVTN